jgi:ERCC4-type nuclease
MASLFSFHAAPAVATPHLAAQATHLTIDYRETELIQCLTQRGTAFSIASLPVGDIWIGIPSTKTGEEQKENKPDGGGIVIERKRITDFEASFLDGRYREQRGRILAFCQPPQAQAQAQGHSHQPLYLLEGAWSTLTGRITKKAMIKLLNRLTLHYQLPLLHTESVEETAEWVECLLEQWKEDPSSVKRTQDLVKVSDGIHIQKKQNASDPTAFLVACLAQCPGLSVKMAESLATAHPCLTQLLALPLKTLEEHKVGTRRLGPAVAKRLWGLLHA